MIALLGNPVGTSGFPTQRVSKAENVSTLGCFHESSPSYTSPEEKGKGIRGINQQMMIKPKRANQSWILHTSFRPYCIRRMHNRKSKYEDNFIIIHKNIVAKGE